jgi:hypothetical protein
MGRLANSSIHSRFWRLEAVYASPNCLARGFATVKDATPIAINPDVIIVGSGAGAMTTSLRAKSLGLSPLIVEKASKVGGCSSFSGGDLWIPGNHLLPHIKDSTEEALKYMEALMGDDSPATSRGRKLAFLTQGPQMVRSASIMKASRPA